MARPVSSGTLLYRFGVPGSIPTLEVLIVHPSGNYNRAAPWGIAKGLPDGDESLEQAARRETLEETGVACEGLTPVGSIDYKKSRKTVHCFVGPLPEGASPRCASWEVDKVEMVSVPRARELLHLDQRVFLDRLLEHLAGEAR